jgi:hypothetical protein
MITVASRERPEKQMTTEDSNSFLALSETRKRIDDHAVPGEKLNEVDTAECRSVLVLFAPGQPEIEALDLEGETSHITPAKRRTEKNPKPIDQCYDKRRG